MMGRFGCLQVKAMQVRCSSAQLLSICTHMYCIFFNIPQDAAAWVDTAKQALGQKFTMPPKKSESQRTKGSLMFRAKKNISGKVATSALMKQKVLNEETRHLLDALVAV